MSSAYNILRALVILQLKYKFYVNKAPISKCLSFNFKIVPDRQKIINSKLLKIIKINPWNPTEITR